MSSEKSQSGGKKTPNSPWFSTPDNVPPKNPKELELSLSSISDSSSNKRRKLGFFGLNYTDRLTGEHQTTETDGSTIPSDLQQDLGLFSEQQESSSKDAIPLDVTHSLSGSSSKITLLRELQSKTYARVAHTLPTRTFFKKRGLSIQPESSQTVEPSTKKFEKKRRIEGSLYSLHMPLGWMSIHGIGEEIRKELREQYS